MPEINRKVGQETHNHWLNQHQRHFDHHSRHVVRKHVIHHVRLFSQENGPFKLECQHIGEHSAHKSWHAQHKHGANRVLNLTLVRNKPCCAVGVRYLPKNKVHKEWHKDCHTDSAFGYDWLTDGKSSDSPQQSFELHGEGSLLNLSGFQMICFQLMHSHLLINFRLKLYNVLFSQFFDFLLIDLCFWIVDRQNLHESVTWVAKTFDPETHLPKIVRTIFSKTLVNSVPIAHQ